MLVADFSLFVCVRCSNAMRCDVMSRLAAMRNALRRAGHVRSAMRWACCAGVVCVCGRVCMRGAWVVDVVGWVACRHRAGRHPEVLSKLCEEVDRVLAGRAPSFEDVPSLEYTTMVARIRVERKK